MSRAPHTNVARTDNGGGKSGGGKGGGARISTTATPTTVTAANSATLSRWPPLPLPPSLLTLPPPAPVKKAPKVKAVTIGPNGAHASRTDRARLTDPASKMRQREISSAQIGT